MTIELFSNILQTIVVSVSAIIAIHLTLHKNNVEYMLAAGSLSSYALGMLYWSTYQLFNQQTPQVFYVADISWVAFFLFMMGLILYLGEETKEKRHFSMFLHLPVLLGLNIFFCMWGDILYNTIQMIIFSVTWYVAVRSLLFGKKENRNIYIFFLLLMLTHYALWIASCFWVSDTWTNPYFWFDFIITFALGMMLPMVKKAVDA